MDPKEQLERDRQRARDAMRELYRNNPEFRERAKQRAREWELKNPERVIQRKKKRRQWLKENNPEEYRRRLAKASENTKKWQAKNKERAAEYQRKRLGERIALFKRIKAEKGCKHCGITDWRCLDFHHRDPDEKEFNLARAKGTTMAKLEQEIAKCDVVCSNCHRIHHTSKDWT